MFAWLISNPVIAPKTHFRPHNKQLVDYHERQVFAGPPETTRDFVVAAARALVRCGAPSSSNFSLTCALNRDVVTGARPPSCCWACQPGSCWRRGGVFVCEEEEETDAVLWSVISCAHPHTNSEKVKKMLSTQIQEAGLKTYLFT
jgi:hypothetical protein